MDSFSSMLWVAVIAATLFTANAARADGDAHKAKHIIVIVQENHSFDNYFGALTYAPATQRRESWNANTVLPSSSRLALLQVKLPAPSVQLNPSTQLWSPWLQPLWPGVW
jgi:phospholipase C